MILDVYARMTFNEIYTEVINRIRIESADIEPNIESQIKASINTAYRMVAGRYKKLITDYLPVIEGRVDLPISIKGLSEIDPPLDGTLDRQSGDTILTKREDGTLFTIKYYGVPNKMIADTDVPDIPDRYLEALVAYPLYVYFLSKKRYDIASAYKTEFMEHMEEGTLQNDSQEYIENVFPIF